MAAADSRPVLMFDHNGVLEVQKFHPDQREAVIDQYTASYGSRQFAEQMLRESAFLNEATDLVLSVNETEQPPVYTVLPNGLDILAIMSDLQQQGVRIGFHSGNVWSEQLRLWNQIVEAGQAKAQAQGVDYKPPSIDFAVVAKPTKDRTPSTHHQPTVQDCEGVTVISFTGHPDEMPSGKAGIRVAAQLVLDFDVQQCFIFDDGRTVAPTAKGEGYQAYLIDQSQPNSISAENDCNLLVALRDAQEKIAVLLQPVDDLDECLAAASVEPVTFGHERSQVAQPELTLSIAIESYQSAMQAFIVPMRPLRGVARAELDDIVQVDTLLCQANQKLELIKRQFGQQAEQDGTIESLQYQFDLRQQEWKALRTKLLQGVETDAGDLYEKARVIADPQIALATIQLTVELAKVQHPEYQQPESVDAAIVASLQYKLEKCQQQTRALQLEASSDGVAQAAKNTT